ncbi:MAG: lytic murein transglycosylase B [Mariprofundaceae bacterium]
MFTKDNTSNCNTDRRLLIKSSIPALAGMTIFPASIAWAKEPSKFDKLIGQLQEQTKLDTNYIKPIILQAQYDASIVKRMQTPYEGKSYAKYRSLFVHKRLAGKGLDYLKEHQQYFETCQSKYHVQPEIISAILGMETRYGRNKGNDRVLDSLFTLATGYKRRASFFRRELGEFLMLCKEEDLDPLNVKGSYAGAFGTTQFIPSSFRGYAVDADQDGKRDVWDSPTDIIHSVGHYFKRHGWDETRPVAYWLDHTPRGHFFETMLKDETKKWHSLAEVRKHGNLNLPDTWADDDRVALIQRKTKQGTRTALVHYNFHVITRWNRSYNYAMAITELAHLLGCSLCKVEA